MGFWRLETIITQLCHYCEVSTIALVGWCTLQDILHRLKFLNITNMTSSTLRLRSLSHRCVVGPPWYRRCGGDGVKFLQNTISACGFYHLRMPVYYKTSTDNDGPWEILPSITYTETLWNKLTIQFRLSLNLTWYILQRSRFRIEMLIIEKLPDWHQLPNFKRFKKPIWSDLSRFPKPVGLRWHLNSTTRIFE